jgi:hypothetical protein
LPHQIVVALPIRQDGKIWTGTVTFTASKPIEVEVEHKYNRYNITLDAKHGEPYHAKWFDGTNIALSTMTGNGGRRRTTRGSYGRTISRWQLNISVHVGADNHDKIIYTYDYIGF